MSGIPPIVPLTLRNEATRVQNQLKVLINNYRILSCRLDKNPENKQIAQQLGEVQDYIVLYNQEQCVLLEKIRQFLKDLETGKFFSRQSLSSSTCESSVASSTGGKPSPGSLSDEELDEKSSSDDESITEVEADQHTQEDKVDPYTLYFTDQNLYRGHVEGYDVDPDTCLEYEEKFSSPTKKFREREEINSKSSDQIKYMKNLELLSESVLKDCEAALKKQRNKNRFKEFLYVPEVSDRKYRNQSFLVKLAMSPPQLRKRKEGSDKPNRPIRAVTFPPVRMGTRKQSSMKQQRRAEEKKEIEKLFKSEVKEEFDEEN